MVPFPFLFSCLENSFEMMTEESMVWIIDVKRSLKRDDIDITTQESSEFNSHRSITVRQANKICVIENGVITEMGTH